MKHITSLALPLAFVSLMIAASPASAGCYADYKAKRDNPLKLHYGVLELPASACSAAAAKRVARQKLAADSWTLLRILSVFDDSGLSERKASAGKYFLRY
ncbi:hypothetical protein [Candidatus Halocynthiibacter alkanivorans]|jgi:hypothetical protein|uniref:hypothetical protein n=1 Tax=Candidatus Halocynthiibacter alkanivorans TaxID=2267619 RepID=UPI000DF21CD5|nr:hypothetical protein [Candidatus Halocynthiibacter alkanivorans]